MNGFEWVEWVECME